MRTLTIIILTILCTDLKSFAADTYNNLWQKGNNYYQQKQYDSASYYYEQIAVRQPQNADVYYNLGNTYYKLNNIGLAVLNYRRALRINPDFKEAKDNLFLTESRINNRIPYSGDIFFIKWWKSLTRETRAT